ncbi:MAG: PEP-CTERM sorting domain-containing protein [Microcystis aeruginosa S11-01]|jgi:hypothetical protein|nr:PEP-CTERM sorting domain-containing protein [Microcystis aeruginosa S11-05]NCR51628.1 PEP-CTERM sorting domain-containing protein [Microcystis aeruginosa S11-01]
MNRQNAITIVSKMAVVTATMSLGLVTLENQVANAVPIILGPTPYLSFNDSPFKSGNFNYFYLENFEDGLLNTPGVTASSASGLPISVYPPDFYTDSVDSDDGVIDGNGQQGHVLLEPGNGVIGGFNFTFDKNTLGTLPTHAGIVWTDSSYGGSSGTDGTPLTFEAFNAQGSSLGKIQLGQNQIGDGRFDGTTSDDRFFGVINPEGISKISISQTLINAAISVDHLQYGSIISQPPKSVPEPSNIFSLGLVGLGLAATKVKCVLSKKAKSPTDNSQTTDS